MSRVLVKDHEKQAGSIGVIEMMNYTFQISEAGGGGVRGAGKGTAQKKTRCSVSERISTMLGCDVDRE